MLVSQTLTVPSLPPDTSTLCLNGENLTILTPYDPCCLKLATFSPEMTLWSIIEPTSEEEAITVSPRFQLTEVIWL